MTPDAQVWSTRPQITARGVADPSQTSNMAPNILTSTVGERDPSASPLTTTNLHCRLSRIHVMNLSPSMPGAQVSRASVPTVR